MSWDQRPDAPTRPSARSHLIAVARGDAAPDTVIEGARVFSAFTREWLDGDVAIADGRIAGVGSYEGGSRIDAAGRYLVPGFIDAHVHLESAKLTPVQFARAVVPRGTTAVVCDPHEIANVAGVPGVEWLLGATEGLPLDVFVMAPSCVPASDFESPVGPLGPDEMRAILRHPRALGVAEMMNFPGVIAGDPDVLARMVAPHVDGHAPGVTGAALDAYVAAGISTDHEAFTAAEALEKRRRGMWVLIREASNARNLRALLAMVREHGPDYCAFCTDDREPDFLYREGHIDQMCRIAVSEGVVARGRARDGLAARRARPRPARPRGDRARLRRRPRAARRPRVVHRVADAQGRAASRRIPKPRPPSCATRCARCRCPSPSRASPCACG